MTGTQPNPTPGQQQPPPSPPMQALLGAPAQQQAQSPIGAHLPVIPPPNPSQLPQVKLNAIERFFLWLSKTDTRALGHCTPEAKMSQTTLGAMVLLTGILALSSSFFMIWTIVDKQFSFALLIPLVYASAIVMFDRELVGFVGEMEDGFWKKAGKLAPRMVLATVLGLAISAPMEQKLFERRIEAEIRQVVQERNPDAVANQRAARAEMDEARHQLKEKVEYFKKEIGRVQKLMDVEFLERNGRGPRYEAFQSEKEQLQSQYQAAESDYIKFSGTAGQNDAADRARASIDKDFQELRRDPLARFEALGRIKEKSPSAAIMSYFVMAIFVLFELFPMVLKWFSKYNEYHAYLNARKAINIQKAHVLANYAVDDIYKNPRNAILYGEYTDMIQLKSEDALGVPEGQSQAAPPSPGPGASPFAAAPPLNP